MQRIVTDYFICARGRAPNNVDRLYAHDGTVVAVDEVVRGARRYKHIDF